MYSPENFNFNKMNSRIIFELGVLDGTQTNSKKIISMLVLMRSKDIDISNLPNVNILFKIGDIIGINGNLQTIKELQEMIDVIYVEFSAPLDLESET